MQVEDASDDIAGHVSGRRSFNISAPACAHAASGDAEDRACFRDDDDELHARNVEQQSQSDAGRKRVNGAHSLSSAAYSGAAVHLQGGQGMRTLHASLGGATSLTSSEQSLSSLHHLLTAPVQAEPLLEPLFICLTA